MRRWPTSTSTPTCISTRGQTSDPVAPCRIVSSRTIFAAHHVLEGCNTSSSSRTSTLHYHDVAQFVARALVQLPHACRRAAQHLSRLRGGQIVLIDKADHVLL